MNIHVHLHKTSLAVHVVSVIAGVGTIIVLAVIDVVWHGQHFDASGFGMGLGAIIGGAGIGSFALGSYGAVAMNQMASGGSGHGKIEGG